MTQGFKFAMDGRISLTESEYKLLDSLVSSGDRGGFYITY